MDTQVHGLLRELSEAGDRETVFPNLFGDSLMRESVRVMALTVQRAWVLGPGCPGCRLDARGKLTTSLRRRFLAWRTGFL